MKVDVIIPAYNEGPAIGHVINAIPKHLVQEIIVVNNNSTDNTAEVAAGAGATVLYEKKKGYGNACLKGIDYIKQKNGSQPDVVVFIDGDFSDHPEEMEAIIAPIKDQKMDMVIGSRTLGNSEKGALQPQQIFGNWLSTKLIFLLYRKRYSDLGPFRAINYKKLLELEMQDQNYGWTVEMQVKAAKKALNYIEIPVSYRKRIGKSKVSGTVKGSVLAGMKIISTIFKNI